MFHDPRPDVQLHSTPEIMALVPRELYRAQGFPESYVIEFQHKGKPLPKTSQVRMCGNSVPPPLSRALALANCTPALQAAA